MKRVYICTETGIGLDTEDFMRMWEHIKQVLDTAESEYVSILITPDRGYFIAGGDTDPAEFKVTSE